MNNRFPFPIHTAGLAAAFGQEMAQAIQQDLSLHEYHQTKYARHILRYALSPKSGMTAARLQQQVTFCQKVQKSLFKKRQLLQYAVNYLGRIESHYRHLLTAETIAAACLVSSDPAVADKGGYTVVVCRDGGKNRYMVVAAAKSNISACWLLFSDGVMLPCKTLHWSNSSVRDKFSEVVGALSNGSFQFDNDFLEKEFKQSQTVDDYFAEMGAGSPLEKIRHFMPYKTAIVDFANQVTLDKFKTLFPELVERAKQLEHKTAADFVKLTNWYEAAWNELEKAREWDKPSAKTLNAYAFRYALWYLLFGGGCIGGGRSHNDIILMLTHTETLLSLLCQETQKWDTIQGLLMMAKTGFRKQQEFEQTGYIVNQSVFLNHKDVPYLLTDFDVEAGNERMEFTRILKGNKLSTAASGKEYADLKDIKQGRYLRHAPDYETPSAACLA